MARKTETAVATTPAYGPGVAVPVVTDGPVLGLEGFTSEDYTLPRLGLAQKNSPEADSDQASYIDGLTYRDYFNTVTRRIYGQVLDVSVIKILPRNFILFRPIDEGGGIIERDLDPSDDRCQWHGQDPPEATEMRSYLLRILAAGDYRPETPDIVSFTFKSTSLKSAKQLNTILKLKGRNVYMSAFRFTVESMSTIHGTHAVPRVTDLGYCSPELVEQNRGLYLSLQDKETTIDVAAEEENPDSDLDI